jgi:hypothetical protein
VSADVSNPYTVTLRRRGKPEKHGCATLAEAVDLLERELRADATKARAHPRDEKGLGRTYTPEMQVVTRGELRGPGGLRAGIDVRGDGDAQAYTGRIRRQLIDVFPREDAYAALRRTLIEEQAL